MPPVTFTNPDNRTRLFTMENCACCCACRSYQGRAEWLTLEFAILTPAVSRIHDVDEVDLIPNGLGAVTWYPVADYKLDVHAPPVAGTCTYQLDWVSPNVQFTAEWRNDSIPFDYFENQALTAHTPPVVPPLLPPPPPPPQTVPHAWHYVFTDTRPRTAGGVIERILPTNIASWAGSEFHAVQLTDTVVTVTTPAGPNPTSPPVATILPDPAMPSGPWLNNNATAPVFPYDLATFPTTGGMNTVGNQWARVGLPNQSGGVGHTLGMAPQPCVRHRYTSGINVTTYINPASPPPVNQTILSLDTSYTVATTIDNTAGTTTSTESAIASSPVSRRDDVIFRYRAGAHNGSNNAVTCGCVPRAGGENSLLLTITPARPHDTATAPNFTPTSVVMQPDNEVSDFTGGYITAGNPANPKPFASNMSSNWRKLAGIRPYYWAGTGFVIGPTPLDYTGSLTTTPQDDYARCVGLYHGANAIGYSHRSTSSPLTATFRNSRQAIVGLLNHNRDITWGTAPVRRTAFDAVENIATTNPAFTAGALCNLTAVEVGAAVAPFSRPRELASGRGYYGSGPFSLFATRKACRTLAESVPTGVTPNLTTGNGGNGVWFTEWFDQPTPVTAGSHAWNGGHEGIYFTAKIQSITITNLTTGLQSVWTWAGTNATSTAQGRFYTSLVSGTVYTWDVAWSNTVNQFGPLGEQNLPYGRYSVVAAYYPGGSGTTLGTSTKTQFLINQHNLGIHHGSFAFEDRPIRTWAAQWNTGTSSLDLLETS